MGIFSALFKKDYTDISNDELKDMIASKKAYQYVDVRTKQEYKNKRIKAFNKNIDYYKFIRNHSMLERISKDKPVVLMCQTGSRSRGTAALLANMGYTEIYNLKRGMVGWRGPVTK